MRAFPALYLRLPQRRHAATAAQAATHRADRRRGRVRQGDCQPAADSAQVVRGYGGGERRPLRPSPAHRESRRRWVAAADNHPQQSVRHRAASALPSDHRRAGRFGHEAQRDRERDGALFSRSQDGTDRRVPSRQSADRCSHQPDFHTGGQRHRVRLQGRPGDVSASLRPSPAAP